jgi:hypothetical protein
VVGATVVGTVVGTTVVVETTVVDGSVGTETVGVETETVAVVTGSVTVSDVETVTCCTPSDWARACAAPRPAVASVASAAASADRLITEKAFEAAKRVRGRLAPAARDILSE